MAKYQLEIYTRPTCSDCQDLKRFLKKHRIPHRQYDLEEHPAKEKELKKLTGNRIVPGIIFSHPAVLGYGKNQKV